MQTKRNPHEVFRLACASQFDSVSVRLLNTALFDTPYTQTHTRCQIKGTSLYSPQTA